MLPKGVLARPGTTLASRAAAAAYAAASAVSRQRGEFQTAAARRAALPAASSSLPSNASPALPSPSAQGQTAPDLPAPAVELHGYHGSPFGERFFRLDAPAVLSAWQFHVALEADYAARPLMATPATPAISRLGQSG